MPISSTDHIFNLVKSLTKAEKRNFKLYVNRSNKNIDLRFLQLFDILDKQKVYNEEKIFKKFKTLNKSQLSNLKRHLYSQLLTSLRLIHINKNIDFQIREQIDFAKILYGKGLYLQSLKLLERIKGIAEGKHQDYLILEILEFQKLIESRHITRSRKVKNKMESLIDESAHRSFTTYNSSKLANLKLKIHGLYIQIGHIRNEKDRIMVQEYFQTNLADINTLNLTFFEKVYLNQCNVWYYYILLDFKNCLEYADKWVKLFEQDPEMKSKDPDLYMRGLHYKLTCLFNLQLYPRFKLALTTFEKFVIKHEKDFNETSHIIAFLYLYMTKLNDYFLTGKFKQGIAEVVRTEALIQRYEPNLDPHRIMVFYYKFAWMYLGAGDYSMALEYLNKIIYLDIKRLREDIQSYARLMALIAHYELGNYQLLEYQIKSVIRFLSKVEEQNVVQREFLQFLNRILFKDVLAVQNEMKTLKTKLEKIAKYSFDKKSFIYLDIISWLDSKIENVSLQAIIQKRFKNHQNEQEQKGS